MRVELSIEGEEPLIYRLKKDSTLVGSSADCDIRVSVEGISRKHLVIVAQSNSFLVIDQGSTNGTFINEDRLVPGQRVDFTSFFPVKLGHLVSLVLLSDEEGLRSSLDISERPA